MKEPENLINVIGVSGCKAPPGLATLLQGCVAVCSSKRLAEALSQEIAAVSPAPAIMAITPLEKMLNGLDEHLERGDCAVLASGDPLFFGIGKRLIKRYGSQSIRFFPALSSMQLACARLGIPWDDVRVFSLHGRRDEAVFGQILSQPKSILFTDGINTPAAIAGKLISLLERAEALESIHHHIRVHVAENLECPGEHIHSLTLRKTAAGSFSPLNIMILEIDAPLAPCSMGLGLTENEIMHLRGMITKDEIRAVVLHKLMPEPGNVLWDIGAGSGSVGLEAARLWPDLTCYAVEADPEQQHVIRENIKKFGLFNVIPVDGTAPRALEGLPQPDMVFIGGSKGQLREIINFCAHAIPPGGIIVANAILETTARNAPLFMENAGLSVDSCSISVTRRQGAGGIDEKLNKITVTRGIRRK